NGASRPGDLLGRQGRRNAVAIATPADDVLPVAHGEHELVVAAVAHTAHMGHVHDVTTVHAHEPLGVHLAFEHVQGHAQQGVAVLGLDHQVVALGPGIDHVLEL